MFRSFILYAAYGRIFAFTIFPYHIEVYVTRRLARQWAGDPIKQPDGAQVDILVKSPPDRDQQPP